VSQTFELRREFRFEAAHHLPHAPVGHPCRRMHGHSYRFVLVVAGPVQEPSGWVVDFGELKTAAEPLLETLDHRLLNEVPGLENPTCEVLAQWIWERVEPRLPLLSEVLTSETPRTWCVYRGPDP
jgi:6-pyruvoyltetrahydropterin/6-carboxytetrahydropterin synthase